MFYSYELFKYRYKAINTQVWRDDYNQPVVHIQAKNCCYKNSKIYNIYLKDQWLAY